ncbi:hypothetical protein AAMO2058_001587600 [Amorphochlora amoebiformis]
MRRLGHAFWRGARARGRAFLSVESGDLKRLLMENEVVVLSRSDDAFGKRVRSFLDTKSIPYRSLEVDIMENGEEIVEQAGKITRQKSLPKVFVGEEYIGGCMDTINSYEAGDLEKMINAMESPLDAERKQEEASDPGSTSR